MSRVRIGKIILGEIYHSVLCFRSYYDNEDFYLNLLDEEMGSFDEDQYLERLKRIG